jgi:acyl-CoA thioesterase-1
MKHLILLLLAFSAHVFAVEPFTDAEKKRLADAERSAKSTPVMREVVANYRAARTAYTEDQKKPATERDKNASKTYREATAVYEAALKKAILSVDANLEPLLVKRAELKKIGLDKANEGESVADSASAKNDAMKPVKDDPKLPRVLLIGDSISIGYTLPTRELLKGKANVHRPPTNCSSTGFGLSQLTSWLGDKNWDVIHFNFGLHDAKLPPEGVRHAPPDVYEKNLRALVKQMKATGAQLIFATTTPVPKGGNLSPTRRFGSVDEYNSIARKVMTESGVAINDLNAYIAPHVEKVGRPTDVHFTDEGYALLAQKVAQEVSAQLRK